MKNVYLLLALCVATFAQAQQPVTKDVGDYTKVKVYDRIVVNLVKSDQNKVVITGEDVDQVVVVNKDGVLKIKMEFDLIFDGNKTFVHVHYTDLEVIDGNEGAVITSNELIEQDKITVKLQEGARARLGLQVKEADLRAVTGGILEVSGIAEKQNITVNTGGIYEGREFETEHAEVFVQAGGEVEIYASKSVDITIRAGGDVVVYGKPASVKRRRTFGGRIKIM